MSNTVTHLDSEAYCVLFLHAWKHPSKAVNGLLLGTKCDDSIAVKKALPLFHSSFSLAPMLEAALMLANEYCKTSQLQIVGYYQANEMSDDLELGPFGKKIADKIRANCSSAVVLLIDGSKMHPTASDLQLLPLGADGKRGGAEPELVNVTKTLADLEECIRQGAQRKVVDFDAHLDDVNKDWLNMKLLS
mmetsp:Transcript_31449/g.52047  ORF Transcript_31449/g.52047 Transcript_31449/m.52047 type:complete len:190 (-) Transcript_31449:57-626(-)|eukprot:CAMPEP_0119316460 /NCGR_PEP_ID=MMETSP1333-20130426/39692_1 /TAXON_ID=418940 /ORGANISM="Scyphosphaera apsteinii, Strain RCC1455" /LENGTH=189 /DNA_ID=CAMNT_0007322107 /DNA_START=42 /DNA_END=611 /DNA_ORIENTATION=+